MEVYIKNNKAPIPVSSPVSRVVTANGITVGKVYYRPTKTRRRVWSGQNHWDLFCFVPNCNEYVAVVTEAGGIRLGRYDGVDIRLDIRKVISPTKMTPMGFATPLLTEPVGSVSLMPEFPSFEECRKCLEHLPFHQPGGAGSQPEEINFRDFVIDAQISYLASSCGDALAKLYDPRKPKPEMLREFAQLANLDIHEIGTFVPYLNWDGTVPDGRVFSIQLVSEADHQETGRKFCERFGVEPVPGKIVWKDVQLKNSETGLFAGDYEAEFFCSNDPEQMSGVTLFVKDAAAAVRLQDVLSCLQIEADYSWSVNHHMSLDSLPFPVPVEHGEHRRSLAAIEA